MSLPDKDSLIKQAIDEAGCSDFGDPWFFDHIDQLIPALNTEARLSPAGIFGAQAMIVGALVKRLRHVELIKANPEILDEEVNVSVVITGLPRTGSTMLHRMIASSETLTGVKWYETQNYVPLPGEVRGHPQPRHEAAEAILAYMLEAIPELMSIHPMSIDQPDEEVIILGQLFSSSMIESTYYVPTYAEWLDKQDSRQAYEDLIQILQSLQWQDPSRKGKSWVLKTPGHLMAMKTVLDAFPEAKIVMTHRDPVSTVPSYCSMEASLYRMGSEDISNPIIGGYWQDRLAMWLDNFMSAREDADEARFVDVAYDELLERPVDEGLRVLSETDIPMTEMMRANMSDWIEANKREHRAPHKYSLEDFGLDAEMISRKYKAYTDRFL